MFSCCYLLYTRLFSSMVYCIIPVLVASVKFEVNHSCG